MSSIASKFNMYFCSMMKKYLFAFVSLLFVTSLCLAQLNVNQSSIVFNTINETQTDSVKLTFTNNAANPITIKSLRFFNIYKSKPFFEKNFTPETLNPGDSLSVFIYFKPSHNIFHNSELLVETSPSVYSLSIDLKAQGKYSLTYYANTENLAEEALKTALKTQLAAGYVSLGYNVARDNMFMTIDNQKTNGQGASVNTLECIYTGKKSIAYTSRTESQTNDNFNTEHTFPQGFFSQNEPMRSDLHHLFPTNDAANNSRSNLPFGIASTPYVSESINNPSHLGSNNLYEPRDVQKGKTARAMMYFVLRYQDYTNFFSTQENILREWHINFPPNTVEKKRNSDIALVQKNRNPFVDYPQFADRITKLVSNSTSPEIKSFRWMDTVSFQTIYDTTSYVDFSIPFINDGNTIMKVYAFASTDTNIIFTNTDTLSIPVGESVNLTGRILSKNKLGDFISTVTFNSNLINSLSFVVQYKIDSLLSGINSSNNKTLLLYPNPSSRYIHLTAAKSCSYNIYNLTGALVQEGVLSEGLNTINIESLNNGVYIIKVDTSRTFIIKNNEH